MKTAWALGVAALLVCVSMAMAGRPLSTNDAEPLGKGEWELELAIAHVNEPDCRHVDVPVALIYGLIPRLEVAVGFGGQFEEKENGGGRTAFEESLSDLTLGFKWLVLDRDKVFFDHALAGGIKIPVADDAEGLGSGQFDYDLTWIISRPINDRADFLFNIGYTWFGDRDDEDFSNLLHYGPAITYQLTDKFQPVAEILFETPVDGGKTSVGANVGVRYALTESVTLDAACGCGLAGDWPDWTATVGMTWGF